MDEKRDREVVVSHIQSLTTRGWVETMQLTRRIGSGCWPGGSSDRTEPGALEWVRGWGPNGVAPPQAGCSCAQGRCALCN
jgi:hypothetical protein